MLYCFCASSSCDLRKAGVSWTEKPIWKKWHCFCASSSCDLRKAGVSWTEKPIWKKWHCFCASSSCDLRKAGVSWTEKPIWKKWHFARRVIVRWQQSNGLCIPFRNQYWFLCGSKIIRQDRIATLSFPSMLKMTNCDAFRPSHPCWRWLSASYGAAGTPVKWFI